ncbi:hypothetical protein [Nocardiopsis ganjiahuensis]|uniref:hypothetical protein n=1 Tax=Nocardiopsis ganjiahuensis TaxID=239984 RepID=UPI00034BDEA5|nr:hypothetical protein [Nocardiopsis ganjiahuensis]
MSYLDELETLLREREVAEERIRETVNDLAAFVAEGDADPEEEFGPVAEFADDLTGGGGGSGPGGEALVWGADAFEAPARMNEMGAQGWEIDLVDRQGRFVSHRDESPQAWEYRQESALGRRERARMAERLAPEGWEPCGHYFTHAYFKRARAALVGPEAELAERPAPARKRFFWGVPGLVVTAFSLVVGVLALLSLGRTLWDGDNADRAATLLGALVGAGVGLGAMTVVVWLFFKLFARLRNR